MSSPVRPSSVGSPVRQSTTDSSKPLPLSTTPGVNSPSLHASPKHSSARPLLVQHGKKKSTFVPPRQFEGPPLPREVEKLKNMPARERVEEGYRMMKATMMSRGSAVFRSTEHRDPYGVQEERITTPQQAAKKEMLDRRRQMLLEKQGRSQSQQRSATNNSSASVERDRTNSRSTTSRSSSWARDTTPRGTYLYNWTSMPQCIPKVHVEPTPGPGAYTPSLFFVGGTH